MLEKMILNKIAAKELELIENRSDVKKLELARMHAETTLIENKIALERLEEDLRQARNNMPEVDIEMKAADLRAFKLRLPALNEKHKI